MFFSIAIFGQEEEQPALKESAIRLGVGWNSYQLIPSSFAVGNSFYYPANRRISPVYYVEYTHEDKNTYLEYGVNFGYETSLFDLEEPNSTIYQDAFKVEHWSLVGVLYYPYFRTDYFSLGVSFMLGGGMDKGTFTDEAPPSNYTEYDYHYQLDPLVIRVGKTWGVEVIGGYGVRGYLRGALFMKF